MWRFTAIFRRRVPKQNPSRWVTSTRSPPVLYCTKKEFAIGSCPGGQPASTAKDAPGGSFLQTTVQAGGGFHRVCLAASSTKKGGHGDSGQEMRQISDLPAPPSDQRRSPLLMQRFDRPPLAPDRGGPSAEEAPCD